ncbi:RNA-binding S4 domain-containing protein [Alicyclobacillus dauci]|uniref:RNA-binding S4 domain-containing protein n=1 Tax=Alicyclobacillus dauci TaxID=1475485 RepID=A0ABY6Z3W2_9BACL|nr:RNA-binding S4 domain-containing protein [Alicyclobacillus dauci]WAH37011.1 RNA-binding S4 domain-containing protein [Alicyclobacillus dauci]
MEIRFSGTHITVGQLLKKLDIVSSGGEVKIYLEEQPIKVNGQTESRRGRKLVSGDSVQIGRKSYLLKGDPNVSD